MSNKRRWNNSKQLDKVDMNPVNIWHIRCHLMFNWPMKKGIITPNFFTHTFVLMRYLSSRTFDSFFSGMFVAAKPYFSKYKRCDKLASFSSCFLTKTYLCLSNLNTDLRSRAFCWRFMVSCHLIRSVMPPPIQRSTLRPRATEEAKMIPHLFFQEAWSVCCTRAWPMRRESLSSN